MYHVVKLRQRTDNAIVTKLHIFTNVLAAEEFMKNSYQNHDVAFSDDSPFEVEALFTWSK